MDELRVEEVGWDSGHLAIGRGQVVRPLAAYVFRAET